MSRFPGRWRIDALCDALFDVIQGCDDVAELHALAEAAAAWRERSSRARIAPALNRLVKSVEEATELALDDAILSREEQIERCAPPE